MQIREQEDLAPWTFWKVGGPADFFCLPRGADEVIEALQWSQSRGLPWTVLGGGSNVLISEKGVEGLVICLRELTGVEEKNIEGEIRIRALAGTPKSELLKIFLKYKLAPALFLSGLPGDVGGGIVMNAGVSESIAPKEFNEIVTAFEVVKEEGGRFLSRRFTHDEIRWHYRHSEGWQPGIVVAAELAWPDEPDAEMMNKVKAATRNRLAKQPLNFPSCGSVFKNPPGHKSGALIEQAGLKGFSVGDAQVSEKHANFIINRGKARAGEVHAVIEHVKAAVKKKFAVDLQTEVRYLGRW
jgi:UDP-N-acetylmuramate dehydrogenase